MVKRSRLRKKVGRKKVRRLKKTEWDISDKRTEKRYALPINITMNATKFYEFEMVYDKEGKRVEMNLTPDKAIDILRGKDKSKTFYFDTHREIEKFLNRMQTRNLPQLLSMVK